MVPKILITGALGQIGSELSSALIKKHDEKSVISSDILGKPENFAGIYEIVDVRNFKKIEDIINKYHINQIYHLASLLSATGEKNPDLAWEVNIIGLKNILDLAKMFKIKVFWPSSIAVFGPNTPKTLTPQSTIIEPSTMYGVTKLTGENLCRYYSNKYNLDVRSVRYPGLISWKTPPGGGTTDYAVAVFYEGIKKGKYQCFVKKDTVLPMMYMDDAIDATICLMEAQKQILTRGISYNLAGISFKVEDLVKEINTHLKVSVTYKPDFRQDIANSWPNSIDDSLARKEWGWKHKYDLQKLTKTMLDNLQMKFSGEA